MTKIILSLGLLLAVAGCRLSDPPFTPKVAATVPNSEESPCCDHEAMEAGTTSDLSVYNLEATWIGSSSGEMQLKDLQGEVVLVAMVYSSCKAACPRILADMRLIEKGVEDAHPGKLRYLLISIDPEVDTPERLKAYSREIELGPNWEFLHGAPDDVLDLAALLGVKYKRTGDTDYAHSNIVTVLNRRGEVVHQQEGLGVEPDQTIKVVEGLLKHEN